MSTRDYINDCPDNEFAPRVKPEVAAEIQERTARTQKYGKVPESADYTRIAAEQRDEAKSAAAPRHELDLTLDLSVERIRRIGSLLRKSSSIDEFGTAEAIAFMRLFGGQMQEHFNEVLRDFVKDKLKR